jgi:2-dehydropantoate 2-reductase
MKIAVVGCGGIGGVIAAILAAKKLNVVCVTRTEESSRLINERGVHLKGKMGDYRVNVMAYPYPSIREAGGAFDVIFLTVKSNVLRQVFLEMKDFLCNSGIVVTLQNGLEMIALSEEFPDVKIVAGAVAFNALRHDYGRYEVTSCGGITFGNLTTSSADDLFIIKGVLEPQIKVDTSENTRGVLWAKLLIVCGVTGLGGVTGLLLGELLHKKLARKLFYKMVAEGACVARELGVRLEKVGGAINPEKFSDNKGGYPLFLRFLLLKIIGLKYKKLKSNIHRDLEMGRRTEVGFINGAVVKFGEEAGVKTPVNRELVRIVEEIENRECEMAVDNLMRIWEKTCGA